MTTFNSFGFARPIIQGIKSAGYETPTPIQAAAIPLASAQHDLIGCAQTGTGKTAAFVLPLLDRMVRRKKKKRPVLRSLIIAPTRELALQITEAIQLYGRYTRLAVHPIYGGVDIKKQIRALRKGLDIVVATPGRLLDHLNRGNIDLSRIEVLVLDEADRMLDMGFIHDIRKIIAQIPADRQTMLFSATMPPKVEQFARNILHEPRVVEVGHRRNPADSVEQHVCAVKQVDKMDLLIHVLNNEPVENVIVFSRTKYRADRISRRLRHKGFASTVIHSNRSQNQRQKSLEGFQKGKFRILVATNIASRGIDVDGVSHVINYDTPEQAENYIHRIGRTGRGEASGNAITFVGEGEYQRLRDIEKHTGKRIARLDYAGLTDKEGSRKTKSDPQANANRSKKTRKPAGRKRGRNRSSRKTASRQY